MENLFTGKQIHIIGMARSGQAAAEALLALGAIVTMHDQKDESKLFANPGEAGLVGDWAKSAGVSIKCGNRAYEGITNADTVVVSPGVPEGCEGLVIARKTGIPILPEIELAYRMSNAPILAITGTNGKTTTTALVGQMLRSAGKNTFIAGNIVAGDIRLALTTAALRSRPDDVIVAEISSFQLETISSFKPKVAALLNVTCDHMDRYTGIEPYAKAKGRIFEYQDKSDFAVVNANDPVTMDIAAGVHGEVWTFGRELVEGRGTFARGTEVWMQQDAHRSFVCDTAEMKLRGAHNLENVMAASAMVIAFGAPVECITNALKVFNPPEHRMEPVAELNGIEFLNNSMCTNVDAAVKSLEAVGRPCIVIAGGKDKGSDFTDLGTAFKRCAKHAVLIGADAGLIERSALAAGFHEISFAESLEDAVSRAWKQAVSGDTIMLSPGCASFDMFKDFEDRGRVFKSVVKDLVDREGA